MADPDSDSAHLVDFPNTDSILAKLPPEVRRWAEGLPWEHRRYVLSLCHLISAAPADVRAEFLDDYTADGLVSRMLEDKDTRRRVKRYLKQFSIKTDLTEETLRGYIRQFYIHSAQDLHRQPDLYLEAALRLTTNPEERNNVFNYILGFELLKMMFCMSWLQHERLYRLQRNQEEFLSLYIRPIQHAHKINGIIVPKDEKKFFAKRGYFVQAPEVSSKKLVELVIATFPAEVVTNFGFSVIRHARSFVFDYDLVFNPEQDAIFSQ
ncbi:MAG: cobyrinic acid a,c-diamide synthase [Leptolyngbyaceae cyanobacterium bins.59]|nr:cobyrinic acid a,c-diamide synthase [Leptolyngbyaceae cyanobacterium bins.59]